MDVDNSLPVTQSELPVAVDATGGDNGLLVQVDGAIQAFQEFGARSVIVGPEEEIKQALDKLGGSRFPIEIKHAPDTITMDDTPSRAVVKKPDSSLCVAYRLVKEGMASSIISSGNSGAMMAAGILHCGLMPGIKRPAIATIIPAVGDRTPNVILDSGANVDCDAHNLVQFAVMGAIYYTSLFEVDKPRIGLLSNGTEASKGTDVLRAAALEIEEVGHLNYVGFVEGRDVAGSAADVIVCDGFVGNVVLKTMEGCVRLVAEQLMHESKKGLVSKIGLGLSKGVFREVFREKFDYTAHGGAPLLGLKKLSIVLHGSSDSRAVKNAIRVADNFAKNKMIDKISGELTGLEDSDLDELNEVVSSVLPRKSDFNGKGKKKRQEVKESQKTAGTK